MIPYRESDVETTSSRALVILNLKVPHGIPCIIVRLFSSFPICLFVCGHFQAPLYLVQTGLLCQRPALLLPVMHVIFVLVQYLVLDCFVEYIYFCAGKFSGRNTSLEQYV